MIRWIKQRWKHLSTKELKEVNSYVALFYNNPNLLSMNRFNSSRAEIKYSLRTPIHQVERKKALTQISPELSQLVTGDERRSDYPELWDTGFPERGASFVQILSIYIQDSGLEGSQIYKKAQIDRRLYSRILSSLHLPVQNHYIPAKDTIISLAMALQLTLAETNVLFYKAGYAFSDAIRRDLIIEYFFRKQIYDIDMLNNTLYHFGEKTLGRQVP